MLGLMEPLMVVLSYFVKAVLLKLGGGGAVPGVVQFLFDHRRFDLT